jgi:hypothetical protein
MTLSVKPVRLNKSIYLRVPSDIADLIGVEDESQVTLTLEERDDRHLLIYSLPKDNTSAKVLEPNLYPHPQPTASRRGPNEQANRSV